MKKNEIIGQDKLLLGENLNRLDIKWPWLQALHSKSKFVWITRFSGFLLASKLSQKYVTEIARE